MLSLLCVVQVCDSSRYFVPVALRCDSWWASIFEIVSFTGQKIRTTYCRSPVAMSSSVSLGLNSDRRSASTLHSSYVAIALARFSRKRTLLESDELSTCRRLPSAASNKDRMLWSAILSLEVVLCWGCHELRSVKDEAEALNLSLFSPLRPTLVIELHRLCSPTNEDQSILTKSSCATDFVWKVAATYFLWLCQIITSVWFWDFSSGLH